MRISIETKDVLLQRNAAGGPKRERTTVRTLAIGAAIAAVVAGVACSGPYSGTNGPIIDRGPDGASSSSGGASGAHDGGAASDARAEDAKTTIEPDGAAGSPDAGSDATVPDAATADAAATKDGAPVEDATSGPDANHAPDAGGGGNDASMTSTCVSSLPAGWSLVAYNTAIDSCPGGYSETIVSGTPVVAAGACTCACSVTQTGSCGSGSLAMTTNPGHGNDTCVTAWFTATVNGSQCIAVPSAQQGNLGNFQASPLPASGAGGACTSTANATAGAVTEPTQRYCGVPAASADAVCNGTPPSGFSACIVAAGAKACPTSTPFVHPFTVETGASLSCGTCSACSVSTTCGSPTLSAFTNANCTGTAALSFAVNGMCEPNPAEQTVLSIQYSANATASCTAGTSAPSVTLSGQQTICCR